MRILRAITIGLLVGWGVKQLADKWIRRSDEEATVEEMTQVSPEVPVQESDKLETIKGIGPVYARRFREAGIDTFAELATTPPERIKEIIGARNWQLIDAEAWIEEAERLAAEEA